MFTVNRIRHTKFAIINWWGRTVTVRDSGDYVDNLKMVAGYYGYDEDEIDELLIDGFTPGEIEEYLCCRW